MKDKFTNFEELHRHYLEGIDFRIIMADRNSNILVLAPHGGGIEMGTSELAKAIAGDDLSLYIFDGIRKANKVLHITSTRFDEPGCLEMLKRSQSALTIHGCGGKIPVVYIGGRDIELKRRLFDTLAKNGYPVQIGAGRYAGKRLKNLCNRTLSGKGVQLEITAGMRRQFFKKLQSRKGRKVVNSYFEKFVSTIRDVLGT